MKITRIEALLLERPLNDRFWMSISPIGGLKPVVRRLILKVYTDAGVVGHGEGTGGGAGLFRQGLADLVIGEDPFMVGKIWEKLFAITYSRELVKRNWSERILSKQWPQSTRHSMTSCQNLLVSPFTNF
jgi:L-alanine-DL-glutamate epimerase-like enolase superfamily enzyme